MSLRFDEMLAEIDWHLSETKSAGTRIGEASSGSELRRSWEGFLGSFGRTIGRLISCAKADSVSRSWGHRLQNASNKDDLGLIYLREARNVAEHGLSPSVAYSKPRLQVGNGLLSFQNVKGGRFSNIVVNGENIGNFTASVEEGHLTKFDGDMSPQIEQLPSTIELQKIYSEQKRKWFDVPSEVWGETIQLGSAPTLAQKGTFGLERARDELANLRKSSC